MLKTESYEFEPPAEKRQKAGLSLRLQAKEKKQRSRKKKTKIHSAIKIAGAAASLKIPMPTTGEISLYFHIPFCRRKCPYCHFYVTLQDKGLHKSLLDALRLEWDLQKNKIQDKKIVSVYFGGGTPFLIGSEAIQEIVSWIDPRPMPRSPWKPTLKMSSWKR